MKNGGYIIHQSMDLGVRDSEVTGSSGMYGTLVNLHTGPRVLDQTLSMRSEDQHGFLFDNLYVNSSGWGGDARTTSCVRGRTRPTGMTSMQVFAGIRISLTTIYWRIR